MRPWTIDQRGSWAFFALFWGVAPRLRRLAFQVRPDMSGTYISKFEFRNIVNETAYPFSPHGDANLLAAACVSLNALAKNLKQDS